MTNKPLHIPHRSRHVPAEDWVDYPRAIHARWQALAARKGFRIDRRVRDRLHLALECAVCGAHSAHKLHTLRTAQPACLGCQADRRANEAKAAGFELLSRDETDHKRNLYRLPCGHERLLQTGRVAALLTQGTAPERDGYHCPICYGQKLNAMAADLGWRLVGPDPKEMPATGCWRTRIATISNGWRLPIWRRAASPVAAAAMAGPRTQVCSI